MPGTEDLVDWDLAVATGVRLARPGPVIAPADARQVVVDLRRYAVEARWHVRAYTGLDVPAVEAPVAVVDRTAWVRSNADGMRHLVGPLADRLRGRHVNGAVRAVGSRLTAVELGAALAWMSGKVLGQYELFPPGGPDGDRPGRLLLVAPNVVQVEQELGVVPADFRLWVCLHEETHRVQFGAVPWLRQHLVAGIDELVGGIDTDPEAVRERLGTVVAALAAAVRGQDGVSLAEAVQTPQQREVLERMTAVMSLLEGHADVVMDGVGPAVVPTVAVIRERFRRRREQPNRAEAAIRRLLGVDAKLAQYRDGAVFVRHAVDAVGMPGFNRVWERPENLPTPGELHDPAAWVSRVHPAP